jgi:hypothetical protein
VALVVVVLIYGSFALGTCLRSCCPGRKRAKPATTAMPATIPFRALICAEPYLPLIHSSLFPEPFLAFDAATVPPRFLPHCSHHHRPAAGVGDTRHDSVRGGLAHLVLCSHKDLPTVPDAKTRARLFATVRYYPPAQPPTEGGLATAAAAAAAGGGGGGATVVVPNPNPMAPRNTLMGVLTPAQLQQPEVSVPLTVYRPLPPGWVVMLDARDGRPYYWHEPTQTVQW